MLKITTDKWLHNERQHDFDQAVQWAVAEMPTAKCQEMIAELLILLTEKAVITPPDVIKLLGADWSIDE